MQDLAAKRALRDTPLTLAERRAAASQPLPSSPAPAQTQVRSPAPSREAKPQVTLVAALVEHLADLGAEQSFGVSGGAIALLFDALEESSLALHHFRHETGAGFAATEAYFVSRKPTVVFATTGPGMLNALTGLTAARWEGAKVILISGATSAAQRGRWATQETSSYTLPQDALYSKGPIFDYGVRIENAAEFPEMLRRLSLGLAKPGGFIAHVCLPMSLQSRRIDPQKSRHAVSMSAPAVSPEEIAAVARRLKRDRFAIWLGFGATEAAPLVRELVERSGVKVFCSPRAKGIVSENHPQFLGVTGLGGHEKVTEHMVQNKPEWMLVLGSRLGEATSFWDRDMEPGSGFIHVDIDPEVPGTAYPECETMAVVAEIKHFLEALLDYFPRKPTAIRPRRGRSWDEPIPMRQSGRSPVRPQVLMDSIQRLIVQSTDAVVLAECGNSFAWCNHLLRFATPGRYRVSTLFGSMGHTAAGVVGAAMARGGKAVAVVGDGSMLMNSEVSTAAQYQTPAVWIVLNDAGYGMCRDGHGALGLTGEQVDFPEVDFVNMARAVGADGVRVDSEDLVDLALEQAMAAKGPFVVDVRIDAHETSPLLSRFESLIKQGNSKNVAGWEK